MEQLSFFRHVIETLTAANVPYMIVGSFASGIWGEPRATYDIDLVVAMSESDLPKLPLMFPHQDYYFSPEAAQHAIRSVSQFNVIHPDSGNKIDFIILANEPLPIEQFKRRRHTLAPGGITAHVASPEDVILGKLRFYQQGGSEKHLRDIAGILKLQQQAIDLPYLDDRTTQMGTSQEWHLVRPTTPTSTPNP